MTPASLGKLASGSSYADVAVPVGVRKTFAYAVPPDLRNHLFAGARVVVPFGRRLLTGFILKLSDRRPDGGFRLRSIRAVIDREAVLPEDLVATALNIARYYFSPPGLLISALFPAGSQVRGSEKARLSERAAEILRSGLPPPDLREDQIEVLRTLARAGSSMTLRQISERTGLRGVGPLVEQLLSTGWVCRDEEMERPRFTEKVQLGVRLRADGAGKVDGLTATQARFLAQLDADGVPKPLRLTLRQARCSSGVARVLADKGLVDIEPMAVDRLPVELVDSGSRAALELTAEQRSVYDQVCQLMEKPVAQRCLLQGVTGSGKTEIYLRLMAQTVRRGGSAILLVPEIGLTPLLSRLVTSHFPGQVAMLHSGLSGGERTDQWNRIRTGGARVVLGTRSAVFAPLDSLRLIVIDEEQDPSYKQDESPCYHAREVAWQRLQQQSGMLLLGSATPSLETHYAAVAARQVARLTLSERIGARPLPEVMLVDMGREFQRHGKGAVLSEALMGELDECLRRGEQSIVLLNRRGYSRSLLCRSCGHAFECAQCSISMTYHHEERRLVCHYCGSQSDLPDVCANCGGSYIYYVGVGTEQLEQVLRQKFPRARLARVDRDSTRRRGALRTMLYEFAEHKLDMLVGTQMLAKGHDFPGVTVVGVVGADVGLSFPDFRAAERTFQLLTQVAGRAGRGREPGRVVVQTFYPDHYALRFAREQDYEGFYAREIEFRRLMGYPPFRRLIQILVSDRSAEKGMSIAEKAAAAVRRSLRSAGLESQIRVLGPAPAPLEKLRGGYRFQILIKAAPEADAVAPLAEAFAELGRRRVPLKGIHVDVDPLSLM